MKESKISERKKKILQAVVDTYINDCEPVSSSVIRDKYMPDVSSATIRSELATLEEMGFLVQPHVSAGRVPSSMAYKYYVDNLLAAGVGEDETVLRNRFDESLREVEDIVRNTAKVISDVTNYTSVIVLNSVDDVRIDNIKLVNLGDNTALVIIVTDSGVISDKMIDAKADDDGYYTRASKILNEIFVGKAVREVQEYDAMVESKIEEYRALFDEVIDILKHYRDKSKNNVYLEGANKIFDYPEGGNIDNVRNFLSVIDSKDKLNEIIESDSNIEFSVKIGTDDCGELENMAVVTAKYSINGREIGHAGVIGPERMDYRKVLKVLNQIAKTVNALESKGAADKETDNE